MNFLDADIKISYKSFGDNQIADSFLNPLLRCTKTYKRSVGFFSSGVLEPIMNGIVSLSRNKGHIQLVASPKLSADDIKAINAGYEKREQIIKDLFKKDFMTELEAFDDEKLTLLTELIARGTLDIKIAVTDSIGEYHDKLGILEDFDGNVVVFYGSANSSLNGYKNNYEKVRVVKSWIEANKESIADEEQEFDSLWNGTNEFVKIYDYQESARSNILEVMQTRNAIRTNRNAPIKLRDYQEKAIKAWTDNDYHGFYVMATGTGKTWTAIFSAKELIKEYSADIVICAPYKHLVKQWAEDVEKAFPDAKIILVSSENPSWDIQIREAFVNKKLHPESQIVIISTIKSFRTDRFNAVICKSKSSKLLIVDEAHRFTDRDDSLKLTYEYMLGLSATPFSGSSAKKGNELMNFFGGQVFSLTIDEALERGYLVNYSYNPIFVNATEDEENKFGKYSKIITTCFNKAGVCINPDLLVRTLRNRLRIISMAEEKRSQIDRIIDSVDSKDHLVVYCGDGKQYDTAEGELRHIQAIKRVLTKHGYRSSQFTASENIAERMALVDAFNKGEISALAAIRCLDEGINIPSIKTALILASNDDYREFVQRRGRILRLDTDKNSAAIYDVIVLPSESQSAWAKIEFRRFYEYAKLATNWDMLEPILMDYLSEYGLAIEDIDVFDYEDMEESVDE